MNLCTASRPRLSLRSALLAGLLALAAAARPAGAAPAPRLQEAVVGIFVSSLLSNGRGSGFPVGDGSHIVTCYHVVTQRMGDDKELPIEQVLVLSPWTGEPLRARIVATDPKADLALLKLEKGRLPALPVASPAVFDPTKPLDEGERFNILGFGQTASQLEGLARVQGGTSTVELLAAAQKADRQVLLFVPTQGAGPGWSGGPVVTRSGQVVGVFRALVAQPQAQDTWYPLATGVEALRALLKAHNVPLTPGTEPLPERPAHADAHFQREFKALVWGMARKWERVETERRAALLLRPEHPITHLGLSLAFMGQGRLEEALKEVETALALDPKRAGAHFQKGLVLQRLNRLPDAEASMRQALEMEPEAAERRVVLGSLLAAQGKMAEAITALRRAAELAPNHPMAHWRLGLSLHADGKFEEAVTALRRAVSLSEPIEPLRVIRADLAESLLKAGKPEDAERELRDMARTGNDPTLQYQLAAFLAARQKSPEALAAIEKCLSLLQQNADPDLLKRATELKARLQDSDSG